MAIRIPGFLALSCLIVAGSPPRAGARGASTRELAVMPEGTTYYVDARNGGDRNSGTSPESAWKSLERVNHARFGPGDRILFAGGHTFAGTLAFDARVRGADGRPILVASFGQGRATLSAGAGDGFTLDGCGFVVVRDLKFIGCGRKNGSNGAGVKLLRTENVELDGLDVAGFRLGGVWAGGNNNTRILRVRAHDNGSAGIEATGGYEGIPRTRNLTIADCVADNNPGDPKNLTNHSGNGIVVGGLDGAVIEYCEASNNGWDMPRHGNGPVGIWGWDCRHLTIQHCISYDNKSPGLDGGGFDFDGGVTDSVLQYNLSYNNAGCGYLLCQYDGAPRWKNNTLRYNISVNDGRKNVHCGIGLWLGSGNFSDAQIYNNTVVNSRSAIGTEGAVPGIVYRNNLLVGAGPLLTGDFSRSRFENNLYWCTGGPFARCGSAAYTTLAEWAKATGQEGMPGTLTGLYTDPRLVLPVAGEFLPIVPRRLAHMPFYRLRPDSPCRRAGLAIPSSDVDFFGHRLLPGTPPSLGADAGG